MEMNAAHIESVQCKKGGAHALIQALIIFTSQFANVVQQSLHFFLRSSSDMWSLPQCKT